MYDKLIHITHIIKTSEKNYDWHISITDMNIYIQKIIWKEFGTRKNTKRIGKIDGQIPLILPSFLFLHLSQSVAVWSDWRSRISSSFHISISGKINGPNSPSLVTFIIILICLNYALYSREKNFLGLYSRLPLSDISWSVRAHPLLSQARSESVSSGKVSSWYIFLGVGFFFFWLFSL